MKLKNILIVVKEIEKAEQFYKDLFGLHKIREYEGNVILSEGLVLQDEAVWRAFLDRDVSSKNNAFELYFEEEKIEAFIEKLENLYPEIEYVNRLFQHPWGQKIIRFYDLDGTLIEVGTPSNASSL
ncbi:MAG: VOC family protein [Bacillota bacterium]|nr:VOC family protein [Bacillota bacterium]